MSPRVPRAAVGEGAAVRGPSAPRPAPSARALEEGGDDPGSVVTSVSMGTNQAASARAALLPLEGKEGQDKLSTYCAPGPVVDAEAVADPDRERGWGQRDNYKAG